MKLQNQAYRNWLKDLKYQVRSLQQNAVRSVNRELIRFYWQLGEEIVQKQKNTKWGDGFLKQLSQDLSKEFPEIKGFSKRNLELIRKWYLFWQPILIAKQAVSQLQTTVNPEQIIQEITSIPWGHNLAIVSKCNSLDEAQYYVANTLKNGWSRNVLIHQIEAQTWTREGKAITNFQNILPPEKSELIQQTLKDPYIFDFLTMTQEMNERDLENQLIQPQHITQFLLELGAGFAYVGQQVLLQVGDKDFYLDLLFYHVQLHCYVVIELKTGAFEPEHAGKLNFYIKAVDEQLRKPKDEPTIGLLLCKEKDKLVVEYALSDIHKPMGISEYQLTQALPDELKSSLPTIEQIQKELGNNDD